MAEQTHAELMEATKEQHDALNGAGIDPAKFIQWIKDHGCPAAKALVALLAIAPILPPNVVAAITTVVAIVCPSA